MLALVIIAATEDAADAFEFGWRTMFASPTALLVLLAQILVVVALAVRGHLVDPASDPLGSAGRFVGLFVLGLAVGMGIGFSQYDGDLYDTELGVALGGGIGLAIAGFAMVVSVLVDRVRPPGRWHRFGVPLLFGVGSGMALLVTQVDPFNVAFYMIFQSDESPALDLGRYLGFTAGAAVILTVAVVVAVLLARTRAVRGAGPTARRVATAAAALGLVIAGVATTAAAANYLG